MIDTLFIDHRDFRDDEIAFVDPKVISFLILGRETTSEYDQSVGNRQFDLNASESISRSPQNKLLEKLTRLINWLQLRENDRADCPSEVLNFNKHEEQHLMERLDRILRGVLGLFLTERGHIGVGSSYIAADDNVCLLFGATRPIVIRAGEGQ